MCLRSEIKALSLSLSLSDSDSALSRGRCGWIVDWGDGGRGTGSWESVGVEAEPDRPSGGRRLAVKSSAHPSSLP